jgi:hypothetical protein
MEAVIYCDVQQKEVYSGDTVVTMLLPCSKLLPHSKLTYTTSVLTK